MSKQSLVVLAVAVVVMVLAPSALAQDVDVPDCVDELDSCGPFVNSTTAKPTVECCKPLKNALKNELPCICSIFASPEIIRTLELNVTAALTLPKRCGVNINLVAQCTALAQAPAPVPQTPAAVPALAPGPTTGDAPSKIASIGSVFGAFLLLATLMFN